GRVEPLGGHPLADQVGADRLRPPPRQVAVGLGVAAVVGVPLDADAPDVRVLDPNGGHVVEQGVRALADLRLAGPEVDHVEDLDLGPGDDDELLVLAAVVGRGPLLVGAVVDPVDDAVLVVDGVGAAAVLGRSGRVRALSDRVAQHVAGPVGRGAGRRHRGDRAAGRRRSLHGPQIGRAPLHAAVGPVDGGARHRGRVAHRADRLDPIVVDAARGEVDAHRVRLLLALAPGELLAPLLPGRDHDPPADHARLGPHDRGGLVEHAPGLDAVAAVEVDRAVQADQVAVHLGELLAAAVRAAVVVGDAVDDLLVLRAAIGGVGHPVHVVVQLRAAVLVLEAVLVLHAELAGVVAVGDAVLVVVRLGAAVPVLERVVVLRLVDALVDVVHLAVGVGVAAAGRAAVLVVRT